MWTFLIRQCISWGSHWWKLLDIFHRAHHYVVFPPHNKSVLVAGTRKPDRMDTLGWQRIENCKTLHSPHTWHRPVQPSSVLQSNSILPPLPSRQSKVPDPPLPSTINVDFLLAHANRRSGRLSKQHILSRKEFIAAPPLYFSVAVPTGYRYGYRDIYQDC